MLESEYIQPERSQLDYASAYFIPALIGFATGFYAFSLHTLGSWASLVPILASSTLDVGIKVNETSVRMNNPIARFHGKGMMGFLGFTSGITSNLVGYGFGYVVTKTNELISNVDSNILENIINSM